MAFPEIVKLTVSVPRPIVEQLAAHCAAWDEGADNVVADALALHFDALAVNDSSLALDDSDEHLVETTNSLVASQAFPGPL